MVASGLSALHLALLDTTPDLKLLELLLSFGANPYIPDETGIVCNLRGGKMAAPDSQLD